MTDSTESPSTSGRSHGRSRPRHFRSWDRIRRTGALGPAALALLALAVAAPRIGSAPVVATDAGGSWSAWTAAAGPTSLAPSLAFNPTAGTLELASVNAGVGIEYTRLVNGSWTAPITAGPATAMPPLLLVDGSGVPQLFMTGGDGQVSQSSFQGGTWSTPVRTGATSTLAPAAVLDSSDKALELITLDAGASLQHRRFVNGAWSSPITLSAFTSLPPALAANPAGGFELAAVDSNGQIQYAHFSGSQWSDLQPTGLHTAVSPALAVSGDGVVHLVAVDSTHTVAHSRRVNGAWTAPAPTGIESTISPALVFSAADSSLELLAVGFDGTVQQARFTGGVWSTPVSLSITTTLPPVLTATTTGMATAVVGTDGMVHVSEFQSASAVAATPSVSFSKDILRIFTSNGSRTCARSGCHGGSRPQQGLNLTASQAYDNIVNVPSNEVPDLNLVTPGDAANSYLFMKVTGASGIHGDRMPQIGGALSSSDIALLRDWINAGAPNN